MQTRSLFMICFLAIFVGIFASYARSVYVNTEYGVQSDEYARILARSCDASVQGATLSADMKGENLFQSQESREKAKEYFFQTLSANFNLHLLQSEIERLQIYVPVLCMIANDGYYICYNQFNEQNGENLIENVITPLNTWAEIDSSGIFMVRFTLTDYVELTDRTTGKIWKGNYDTLYRNLGMPLGLAYMAEKESFYEYRTSTIIAILIDQIEYYINEHNYTVGNTNNPSQEYKYTFTLPEIEGEDWGNLLKYPTCIAFLQGIPVLNQTKYLNIYAMGGSELSIDRKYTIMQDELTGEMIYHRLQCTEKNEKGKQYRTREECAKKGAFPCELCNP